jgi:DNA (cytosine-5)-methyltransferase 1
MYVLLRRLGEHRGAPRLYLDTAALSSAGLAPGTPFNLSICIGGEPRITIRPAADGRRKVSHKQRGRQQVPVIDINSQQDLLPFVAAGVVRIVIDAGSVHVLLPASVRNALARSARLAARLAMNQPLRTAGIAFGAGIASLSLHEGLAQAGVPCTLTLANEIGEEYLDLARANHPSMEAGTVVVSAPMQEAVVDDWLMQRVGTVELLEAGIPCSGASKAGRAKRGLARMEDHPWVGHLIGACIVAITRLQPAVVLIENVESYSHTASASILRGWLLDAGYAIHEVVLDASDFGSLEARVRWFLVAAPAEIELDLQALAHSPAAGRLADVLEPIGPDDERFRTAEYLKTKASRDEDDGKGFAMQWITPACTRVPTLRKGYHKGGSTDPRLLHPNDPARSRLLTGTEHARIKGVCPSLLDGASETLKHQVCGQAVDVRPVRAIGHALGLAMRKYMVAQGHMSPRTIRAVEVIG